MSPRQDQWRRGADAGITQLAERFPKCFTVLGCSRRPLKIGVNSDVVAAMAGEMTAAEVGAALKRYVCEIGYQRAMVAGAARIDLQGNPAGTVTESEEAAAWDMRRRFVERVRARQQRAEQRAARLKAIAEAENEAQRGPRVTLADLKRAALERKRARTA